MKSCPTCNRTFEDTFTFCLIDGSILSAPFDPLATVPASESRQTEPPPTEVLKPQEEIKEEIPQTIRSPKAEPKRAELASTIAAPAPEFESSKLKASLAQGPAISSSRWPLIISSIGALLIIGLIFFPTKRTDRANENGANKNTAAANLSPSTATNVSTNSAPGMGNTQVSPSPSPVHVVTLEETVWEGLMSREYQRTYEFKTGGQVIEKAGGRVGVKTPVSVRTGSWTLEENRVSMKFPTTKNDAGMEIEATIQGIGYSEMTGDVKWVGNYSMRDTIRVSKIK